MQLELTTLPPPDEMLSAFMARDATYDGVYFTAVTTTGIFCLPSCPARKPLPENVAELQRQLTEAHVRLGEERDQAFVVEEVKQALLVALRRAPRPSALPPR
mgnify:CR=1 FL=1